MAHSYLLVSGAQVKLQTDFMGFFFIFNFDLFHQVKQER